MHMSQGVVLNEDQEDNILTMLNDLVTKIINKYPSNVSVKTLLESVQYVDAKVIGWLKILLQYLRPKDLILNANLAFGYVQALIEVFPNEISGVPFALVIKNNYVEFLEATQPLMHYRGDMNVVDILPQY